jgi:WD40 repeat protein/tRNA A-37 threonylcarbamoyl transferase component Bud32
MPVKVQCSNPDCQRVYNVSAAHIGKSVRCKQCSQTFVASATSESIQSPVTKDSASPELSLGKNKAQAATANQRLGRFEIRARLGGGAFGIVYRAFDPQLEREVALKVPRPGTLDSAEAVERFMREAKAAAQLRHPNIVPIYDAGQDGDQYYIASAFIAGQPLERAVESGALDCVRAARIVHELAEAFDYAHSQGIIHRDIKPANVMLDGKDHPHVMDFGLARLDMASSKLTQDGTVMGTPAYMSPEQAAGDNEKVNAASDQYSLGVLFYELLTGRTPFSGPPQIVIVNVLTQQPQSLRSIKPAIPKDLETVCLKAMAKESGHRYDSCRSLAGDLRRWIAGEPITARRISYTERFVRWSRRNVGMSSLIAIAALLVVTVAVISTVAAVRLNDFANRARKETERANLERTNALSLANANAELAEKASASAEDARRQNRLAERHLYAAQMNLVQSAWNDDKLVAIDELLEKWIPQKYRDQSEEDLRGFEWFYWDHLTHSQMQFGQNSDWPKGHSLLAISEDWLRCASISGDEKSFTLWSVKNGDITKTTTIDVRAAISNAAFNKNGTRIAVGENWNGIKLYDTNSGKVLHSLGEQATLPIALVFSPDGKHLASGGAHRVVKIWNSETAAEVASLDTGLRMVLSLQFGKDGKCLMTSGAGNVVKVWDVATGKEVSKLVGHTREISCIAYNADNNTLASGASDGMVRMWNPDSGSETRAFQFGGAIGAVAFSRDGTRIASRGGHVQVWNTTTNAAPLRLGFRNNNSHHGQLSFSTDGRRLIISGGDGRPIVLDATNGQGPMTFSDHVGQVTQVKFSPDGKRVASASSGDRFFDSSTVKTEVKVWDSTIGQTQMTLEGQAYPSWSSDGKQLATIDRGSASKGEVKIWDVATGRERFALKGHATTAKFIAYSADGSQLASASDDKTVKLWDTLTGQEKLTLSGHTTGVRTLAFSIDGKQLVSASGERDRAGEVILWDATNGQMLCKLLSLDGHTASVHSVAFGANDTIMASAGDDHMVKLWDTAKREEIRTLKGHSGAVAYVAYSPDGKRLASCGADDSIKIWDVETGHEMLTLKHIAEIYCVAFSSDGKRLASASNDRTVKVWDARPWTSEVRNEQEALSLIWFYQAKGLANDALIRAVTEDSTVVTSARECAIKLARSKAR